MEERTELKTIRVTYRCPRCNEGHLLQTGVVLTSNPPQYPHYCDNKGCDYTETFKDKKYPRVEHEEGETTTELTEDQRLQEIVDAINYNNLCARATLFPGLEINKIPLLTIEELKKDL